MDEQLKLAKSYKNKRNWDKALQVYEKIYDETEEKKPIDFYVEYSLMLRLTSHNNKAKELIEEALSIYENNEKLLNEFYKLYDGINDWEKANVIAKTLVEINNENYKYHFLLGRSYAALKLRDEGRNAYISGLEKKHQLTLSEIIAKIEHRITSNPQDMKTEYMFIDGQNNYGAFIHTLQNKKYFTKISKYKRDEKREEIFYENITQNLSNLNQVIPEYINTLVLDNTLYLTLEFVEEKSITNEDISKIIDASQIITSISLEKFVSKYPNPNYPFQIQNKPISIVIFFTKIHKKSHNERLFTLLEKLIKDNGYPNYVLEVVQQLKSLILENRLYYFIDPEIHYSLIHGDFIPANLKMDKHTNSIKVFDWATFKSGPKFLDMARYFTATGTSYNTVKIKYLHNDKLTEDLSTIEKIFFLYSLILLYILRFKENSPVERFEKYISKPLQDLFVMVDEFNTDIKDNDTINKVIEENINYQEKIELLKKENKKQTEKYKRLLSKYKIDKIQNKKLQKRYNHILESKSWKFTAPLRKLMQIRKK